MIKQYACSQASCGWQKYAPLQSSSLYLGNTWNCSSVERGRADSKLSLQVAKWLIQSLLEKDSGQWESCVTTGKSPRDELIEQPGPSRLRHTSRGSEAEQPNWKASVSKLKRLQRNLAINRRGATSERVPEVVRFTCAASNVGKLGIINEANRGPFRRVK